MSERDSVIFHRHAEVIVPDELDLNALRFVACRTSAEYQTLLHLLDPAAATRWSKKIGLGARANLHYRHWNFVEDAKLDRRTSVFQFNPSARQRGPFDVRAEFVEEATGTTYTWQQRMDLQPTLAIDLGTLKHPSRYRVSLTLDGRVAYANRYAEDDLPF
jgi:hypothetical protein